LWRKLAAEKLQVLYIAQHVSGVQNGAERVENWMSGSGAVSTFQKTLERERSVEQGW